jgi:hypothetical protein
MAPESSAGPTPVSRCALLFGTPVDWDEFAARSHDTPPSDYLARVLRGDEPEVVWKRYYAPVAAAAANLIKVAQDLGATVVRKATIRDFSDASLGHDRVILLAHWRGAIVSRSDLAASPEEVVRHIASDARPLLQEFAGVPVNTQAIVDALNRTIEHRSLVPYLPRPLRQVAQESVALGRTLCRDLLDETFEGFLVPGNRIELFDGLHSLGAMEHALSETFCGELDLATCNSEAFAVYLDLRRRNRVRHLHWSDLINPIPQYLLISETLRRLAISGGSYIETRLTVEEAL